MRGIRAAGAVGALLVAALGAFHPVEANCTTAPTFSTKNGALYGGQNRISTPGGPFPTRSVSDFALGYFWSLGYGSPDTYAQPAAPWDNDCGKQANGTGGNPAGRCGSPLANADWWIVNPLPGDHRSYIGGNFNHWKTGTPADGCVDWDGSDFTNHRTCVGCLDQNQCMVALLTDAPTGAEGFFLLLADEADNIGHYSLNEAVNGEGPMNPGMGETLFLVPVPKPSNVVRTVVSTTHVRFELEVDEPPLGAQGGRWEACAASTPAGGCVAPPADPGETPCHPTVCGFGIYTQVRLPNDPPPASRNVKGQQGWVRKALEYPAPPTPACTSVVGPEVAPFGVRAAFEEIPCSPGRKVYICATLILDSGFETPYCSADVTLTCGPGCAVDGDCHDGRFCTGSETCNAGNCQSATSPCSAGMPACDENEDMCLASGTAGGAVPDGDDVVGQQLKVGKAGGNVTLTWGPSCSVGDADYGIYEGQIGSYYSHRRVDCTDGGVPFTEEVTPSQSSSYYLVVPSSVDREGSYGTDSNGVERPPGYVVCKPQEVGSCE